jgi:anti-sigma B factor antagonist
VLIEAAGELDLDSAPMLCAAIADGRYMPVRENVVVDLSRVEFCDSTGLKALVDASREVRIGGGVLVAIVPADGAVRRVIALTGVDEFLRVSPDRDRVMAALTWK